MSRNKREGRYLDRLFYRKQRLMIAEDYTGKYYGPNPKYF